MIDVIKKRNSNGVANLWKIAQLCLMFGIGKNFTGYFACHFHGAFHEEKRQISGRNSR